MVDRAGGPTAEVSAGAGEAPAVLIIDDDGAMVESLTMLLEDHGFRVLTAPNGIRGLHVFRERRPAAVLTDILMPEKDGIETIVELRRSFPGTKIIAISGRFRSWNYLTLAKKLGADAAFEKGRPPALLIETLNRLLERP
jgi:DNA-binding response OmpR family regulator